MTGLISPRRFRVFAAVAVLVSFAAGCSGSGEPPVAPTVTEPPVVEPSKTAAPEPAIPVVWPLTGKEVPELPSQPAVAVKIENTAAARPQTGLNQADVVWETIIEFDVSRFLAVYHSNYPEAVGPIRSVRPIDMRIYAPLDPVFVFSGGQAGILQDMRNTQGIPVDEDRGIAHMWRDRSRIAPHNLYGSVADLATLGAGNTSEPQEQFQFARQADEASATALGQPATGIALNMSAAAQPQWSWNESASGWERSEGAVAALDSDGAQLTATNVVILEVDSVNSGYKAQNNAPVPDNILEGTGLALVASGGKTIEGTWSKQDKNSPVLLHLTDSDPLYLAPGNTWVELLPQPNGSYTLNP